MSPPSSSTAAERPSLLQLALLTAGFRPFYLLAAVWAALAVPLWLVLRVGGTPFLPASSPLAWHTHEMVFAFASAVLVGFLYTAVPNWTGRPTPTGGRLLMPVFVWLAGRVAMMSGGALPWWLIAGIDVAFLPLAALGIAAPLIAARNRRNMAFPFVLLGLAGLNVLMHMQEVGLLTSALPVIRLTLDIFAVILLVMAGRVIPFFAANALPNAGVKRSERLDRIAVAATVAAVVAYWIIGDGVIAGILAIGAAAAVRLRMLPWRPARQLRTPMLAILVVGHGWVAVWLLLRGLSGLSPSLPPVLADHALGVGALGALTLGMMSRSALGHTGRKISADWKLKMSFAAVTAAAVLRIAASFLPAASYDMALMISAALWMMAFGLFTLAFLPILTRPRVDGRMG